MKIIKLKAVEEKIGLKHSAIYKRMHAGTFPRQVRMGPRCVGWLESEIDEWIASLITAREAA